MGSRGRPVTEETRARVRALHADGYTRNGIARDLDIAAGTVTKIVQELGLSFDRSATEPATRAKVADAKASRAEAVLRLYHQAHAQLDRLDLPEHELAQPSAGTLVKWTARYLPAQDVKALLQAAGKATQDAVKLEQVDADTQNLSAVDAWLDAMTDGADEPAGG